MKSIILIDLEKNPIQANSLRLYIENEQLIYLFHPDNKLECALDELTELSSWINSGQVIILDIPKIKDRANAYALIAGQLLALIESDAKIEIISKNTAVQQLLEILQASGKEIEQVLPQLDQKELYHLPSMQSFNEQPMLREIKKYCDAVGKTMKGIPLTVDGLKNSIANILQLSPAQVPQIMAMLINLKIIKRDQSQIKFRKKILKQWVNLELIKQETAVQPTQVQSVTQQPSIAGLPHVVVGDVDSIMQFLKEQHVPSDGPFPPSLDELQWQALQKLDELKLGRPKDIFSLRDMLQDWFPQANIQNLLKALMDKGYIQLNGDQLHYSHQMFIH